MIPFPKHKTQTQNKNIKHTAGGDSGSSISIPVRETQRVAPSIEKNQSNKLYRAQERLSGFSRMVHHVEGQKIIDPNVYTLSETLIVKQISPQ